MMAVCKSGTDRGIFLVYITALDAQDVRNMSGLDNGRKICIFSEGGMERERTESSNVGENGV